MRGQVVPVHTRSAEPCQISGFYSNTVSIGRFWTGKWVNLHVSMISVAAAHSQGMGAEREVSQETVAAIQAKDDGGSDQSSEM